MDRLVCGDVGYGKTEVALRASFLATNSHKQVAVLVPTTILAEQHYDTFRQRYSRYPVHVACLSRFRTAKEQRQIVSGVAEGKIDIVIGTHRLLQKDISFDNLGLLIVDEEQRFGVRHKEKLKKFRSSVDVLALTATPIPRTLHLSLTGIRDISLIATPPEYRKSIITYVSEFDDALVTEAIRKELRREGQVFFVHNNVRTIDRMARKLQRLVPEVRTAVAHGQMAESELEQIMLRFIERDIDLLVCTTIIESGLDIPSVNTIVVNRADRFGLAQMYQLRGRVGRAGEQAYAYLLIPPESLLTRDAQKRLKVLMEHSDLGSGFQIAMNDLRIRGGGTILGASQSGHIAAVGYDMFLKLMETAISEVKGQPVVEPLDPEININRSAFFSEAYIPDIDQRMLMYRRLSRMGEEGEIDELKSELLDRFGPIPAEAKNLLLKIRIKVSARKAAVSRLDLKNGTLYLYFSETHLQHPDRLIDLIVSSGGRYELSPEQILKTRLVKSGAGGPLTQTKNILKEIAGRVNS
jgi:transcription-repair coupling factor (superfamily II helicase)